MTKVVDLASVDSGLLTNGAENDFRSLNGVTEAKKTPEDAARGKSFDERPSTAAPRFIREAALNRETLLGPRRPQPHKIWRKRYVKLLVVGDSGLGKTTLIQTLLTTPGERLNVHDGSSTPTEQFKADPDSLLSTVQWKDEEDRVVWVFQIQDTPGYGDDLYIWNHINMLLAYVERQNQSWLHLEQHRRREVELFQAPDPRVDMVLYCLPPHRLRAVDLRYMYELSRVVPILPIVTKADTMTIKEAQVFRQELFSRLLNPNLPSLTSKIEVFEFERDTLMRAGVQDSISGRNFPFLVVASNDINSDMDKLEPPIFWPERSYNWGTAEAFNTGHSDLLILRALLLKEALEDISYSKRIRYEQWRRKTLCRPQIMKKLLKLALWTLGPIALALHAGHNGYGVKDLPKLGKVGKRWLHSSLMQMTGEEAPKRPTPTPIAAPPPPPPPAPEPEELPIPVPEPIPEPPAPAAVEKPQKKGWF